VSILSTDDVVQNIIREGKELLAKKSPEEYAPYLAGI